MFADFALKTSFNSAYFLLKHNQQHAYSKGIARARNLMRHHNDMRRMSSNSSCVKCFVSLKLFFYHKIKQAMQAN